MALATKVQVNAKTSRWMLVDYQRIVCCGGSEEGKKVQFWTYSCLIEKDGTVCELPNMLQARCNHGLIQWQRTVLVFGGAYEYGYRAESECIQLTALKSWKSLPNMSQGKANFNACRYAGLIYLCGGMSSSIEAFNPQLGSFHTISLGIPEGRCACYAYVDSNALVLHTRRYMLRYKEREGELEEVQRTAKLAVGAWEYCLQPVLCKNWLYCVGDSMCWRVDCRTGERDQTWR